MNKKVTAVIDTGASCSVISEELAADLGIKPDVSIIDAIITADVEIIQLWEKYATVMTGDSYSFCNVPLHILFFYWLAFPLCNVPLHVLFCYWLADIS
ncbi:hypothetical protein BB560_005510 [Smittium megazygosporum]|uniref:Peptidase A2 domain-containing protein n=1 Tax=Smittium megazygosporum TaxID=133381 RepID=A0A2T9Z429_9FUNG|nr:hypothetical protein BB560_005510 [Smittium megazygosporum]